MSKVQYLGIEDVPRDFEKQMKALNKSLSSKQWNKKVIGGAMVVNVVVGFLKGVDPNDKKWKSNAAKTKFSGKFAEAYNKRPSGKTVNASSLRLNDSGDFMESYDVLWASQHNVEVGPVGPRNRRIAEAAETSWKNKVVGWGKRGRKIVDHCVSTALDYVMAGRTPPKIGYITRDGKLRGMF